MSCLFRFFIVTFCFEAAIVSIGAEKKDDVSAKQKQEQKMNELEAATVSIASSKDGTSQKMIFYAPPGAAIGQKGEPLPLLVMLHTWSGRYDQGMNVLPAVKRGKWIMVAPDFRGNNDNPQSCASEYAIQDVLDAVEYARKNARVDESKIYLLGLSGGGHMALMMAAKAPNLWAAVSSWVPISDLSRWHAENIIKGKGYSKSMENVCGGPPGKTETDSEYHARSPIFFLDAAKNLPLDINAGIHDGHSGSVPISHSLRAFNVLAAANGFKDRLISEDDIAFMTEKEKIPQTLENEKTKDSERGRAVLFRREAGSVRITIFEGGHEGDNVAAFKWLARQKKGMPVAWKPDRIEGKPSSGDADSTTQVAQ
jgi:dipeptidyl aminopeptidase/acylaminoacyl peptidase